MAPQTPQDQIDCPSLEISAYIDRELPQEVEAELELHFGQCSICVAELNRQKSFLTALSASLEREDQIELPKNFTRSIVANAESRVSGLRRPGEWFTAVFICTALLLFALFAFGNDAESVLRAFGTIAEKVFAVMLVASHYIFDLAVGIAIIVRSLSSKFVFGSVATLPLLLVLVSTSIFAFSRLAFRRTRTQED